MVKASVMAGAGTRGGPRHRSEDEDDYGLPITSPVVMIPIIGLIIMFSVALITCFCKLLPHLVPENMQVFGKRSRPAEQNLELQLRRRTPRRPSETSQVSGKSHGRNNHRKSSSRTPSFNTNNPRNHSPRAIQEQSQNHVNQISHPYHPSHEQNGNGNLHLHLDLESGPTYPGEVTHGKVELPTPPPPPYDAVQNSGKFCV